MTWKPAAPATFSAKHSTACPPCMWRTLCKIPSTLTVAQQEAKALLALDPNLAKPEHKALSDEVERLFATAGAMN